MCSAGNDEKQGPNAPDSRFSAQNKVNAYGAPSLLLGIVAQTRSLLFAVDSHHDRVQVEEQTAGGRGNLEPLQAQAIMQANQLANSAGRKGFKKSSQPGLIRKAIQAQQIEE